MEIIFLSNVHQGPVVQSPISANPGLTLREHEGTERDTPSHGFVICHSH